MVKLVCPADHGAYSIARSRPLWKRVNRGGQRRNGFSKDTGLKLQPRSVAVLPRSVVCAVSSTVARGGNKAVISKIIIQFQAVVLHFV